jgi:isoaspartyl peptidase/L-asparaginase-like protein (Ntn-hydrolase superfamily)
MRPQAPEKQKQKVEAELNEANLSDEASPLEAVEITISGLERNPKALYFQAEELALRAIQAEYGKPIT